MTQAEKAEANSGIRKACVEAVFLSFSPHCSHKFSGGDSKDNQVEI
jgi:hypothetical protein